MKKTSRARVCVQTARDTCRKYSRTGEIPEERLEKARNAIVGIPICLGALKCMRVECLRSFLAA